MASNMPADVEERIRALPGNGTCSDCSNQTPQWASVTYGTLMCLECSGQHRSLGVHLSFVRSVQMDSWTEKQIMAMEKSGGNAKLVEFFKSKGIEQDLPIHKKYNTPQARYYRDRLARWLEGKTEPPPDPGMYDPATGLGDAQGAEALPGETTDEYNARQARLKEAARERMRAKFGDGGMIGQGIGSDPDDGGDGLGAAVGAMAGAVGGVAGKGVEVTSQAAAAVTSTLSSTVSGGVGFLKSNVIENADLHSKVKGAAGGSVEMLKGAAGGATEKVSGLWGSLKQQVADGELLDNVKKNASGEDGTVVNKGLGWGLGAAKSAGGWGLGAATSFWNKASETVGDAISGNAKPCTGNHQLTVDPRPDSKCVLCGAKGTRYACSLADCDYIICPKCFEKPPPTASKGAKDDDDGWDDWSDEEEKGPPPEVTADDMARIAKELGMDLGKNDAEPKASGYTGDAGEIKSLGSNDVVPLAEAKPKPKPKPKPADPDDFFADFGLS